MSTIYKCDKCGKTIKSKDKFSINLSGPYSKLKDNSYMSFEFCEKCAKSPFNNLKNYLNKT